MKQFEIKALGLEELKSNEQISTDGGSVAVLFVVAACLLLSSCQISCGNTYIINSNNGNTREGGVDAEADVSVI